MDPPIFICENPQAHSVCSTCHESLTKDGKTCPVCRKAMKNRRSVTLESMLENVPKKVNCKFDGCDFKRSDGEAVKRHEDGCENRYVPCAFCDDKIGQKSLAAHIRANHHKTVVKCTSPIYSRKNGLVKTQAVLVSSVVSDTGQQFLLNWCTLDEVSKLFWISYSGPKDSAASFKYTLQVCSKENKKVFLFEGTRRCVPCDLSHDEIRAKRWALVLDNDLIEDATRADNKVVYWLTILKV